MSIISVIVPVHNTAGYLKRCIDSIRNQTLIDIEIILVENLSSDGSAEICDEYARIEPRIKVLHLNVGGPSIARNEGMKIARSPYFGFIDSDDYIDPDMYEYLLYTLQAKNVEMVFCNLRYEYENGTLFAPVSNTGKIRVMPALEALKDIFRDKVDNSFCSKLFKRELFDTLMFPEGYFYEDHALIYKVVNLCQTVAHIDHPFYHYVQRQGSISHDWSFTKDYHVFLADYDRLEFIRKHHIYNAEEHREIISGILNTCLSTFRNGQLLADKKEGKEFLCVMKKKLKSLLTAKDELRPKIYYRLWKMIYIGPLEGYFHKLRSRFKKKY